MPKPIATLRRQFVWLAAVLLSVAAARVLAGHYVAGVYDAHLHRIAETERANQRILQDLTDIETGVRGYQLTGDPTFLEPFRAGASDYPAARDAALRAAPDDRTRVLVRDQDQAAQRWLAQVALPISALPAGRPGVGTDRSARGKLLFDEIRAANAAVAAAVAESQAAATASHRTAGTVLETALAVLTLLSVLVAVRVYRSAARLLTAAATGPIAGARPETGARPPGADPAAIIADGPDPAAEAHPRQLLRVSATPSVDGGVRLTVTARGDGVPSSPGGLDLALCRRVVSRHGGTIITSGAAVHIELPASCVAQPVGS
ncbi:CHASE3 domain-containing protein [Dactylosporangium sp. NPDC050688]|uniref:CHASE3 domain-containing protein n=1 Tax=Dactylosporangium sp. NPDC050688 TaxID=3157217 RepID=UPI0033E86E12